MSGEKSCCPCHQKHSPEKRKRVDRFIFWIIVAFMVVFLLGLFGFRYLFQMEWSDAFYNAALTTSTIGSDTGEINQQQKIFLGIYALISGILFISIISAMVDHIIDAYLSEPETS